ncbi:hypothetical protein CTAYLR_003224 [Chrysophaeum taylorii]|uniref:Uncharacterized protein n=1 Tax=Chrysophaeum taylorii TaxID=2483200 RepID=A0AAD7XH40_9STRA|nr:hypothetical protein CTAYLR_003224 [Chrysophaeum taylorii]
MEGDAEAALQEAALEEAADLSPQSWERLVVLCARAGNLASLSSVLSRRRDSAAAAAVRVGSLVAALCGLLYARVAPKDCSDMIDAATTRLDARAVARPSFAGLDDDDYDDDNNCRAPEETELRGEALDFVRRRARWATLQVLKEARRATEALLSGDDAVSSPAAVVLAAGSVNELECTGGGEDRMLLEVGDAVALSPVGGFAAAAAAAAAASKTGSASIEARDRAARAAAALAAVRERLRETEQQRATEVKHTEQMRAYHDQQTRQCAANHAARQMQLEQWLASFLSSEADKRQHRDSLASTLTRERYSLSQQQQHEAKQRQQYALSLDQHLQHLKARVSELSRDLATSLEEEREANLGAHHLLDGFLVIEAKVVRTVPLVVEAFGGDLYHPPENSTPTRFTATRVCRAVPNHHQTLAPDGWRIDLLANRSAFERKLRAVCIVAAAAAPHDLPWWFPGEALASAIVEPRDSSRSIALVDARGSFPDNKPPLEAPITLVRARQNDATFAAVVLRRWAEELSADDDDDKVPSRVLVLSEEEEEEEEGSGGLLEKLVQRARLRALRVGRAAAAVVGDTSEEQLFLDVIRAKASSACRERGGDAAAIRRAARDATRRALLRSEIVVATTAGAGRELCHLADASFRYVMILRRSLRLAELETLVSLVRGCQKLVVVVVDDGAAEPFKQHSSKDDDDDDDDFCLSLFHRLLASQARDNTKTDDNYEEEEEEEVPRDMARERATREDTLDDDEHDNDELEAFASAFDEEKDGLREAQVRQEADLRKAKRRAIVEKHEEAKRRAKRSAVAENDETERRARVDRRDEEARKEADRRADEIRKEAQRRDEEARKEADRRADEIRKEAQRRDEEARKEADRRADEIRKEAERRSEDERQRQRTQEAAVMRVHASSATDALTRREAASVALRAARARASEAEKRAEAERGLLAQAETALQRWTVEQSDTEQRAQSAEAHAAAERAAAVDASRKLDNALVERDALLDRVREAEAAATAESEILEGAQRASARIEEEARAAERDLAATTQEMAAARAAERDLAAAARKTAVVPPGKKVDATERATTTTTASSMVIDAAVPATSEQRAPSSTLHFSGPPRELETRRTEQTVLERMKLLAEMDARVQKQLDAVAGKKKNVTTSSERVRLTSPAQR